MTKPKYGFRLLRFKLALTSTLVEIVMLAFLISNSVAITTQALEDQMRYRVQEIIPLLNASLAAPLVERDYATLNEILNQVVRKGGIEYLGITDVDDHLVAELGEVSHETDSEKNITTISDISAYQHLHVPITLSGATVGDLHLSIDTSFLYLTISALQREGMLIAGGEILITFVLLVLVGVLLTRNLATLANASRSMTGGDLSVRVAIKTRDEIGDTARAFNTMAERLETSYNALKNSEQHSQHSLEKLVNQRTLELEATQGKLLRQERLATLGQLTATVSHELRNPLGVISNAAYYLKRRCQDSDGKLDEKVEQYLDMIKREVAAADCIISDLLATSRTKEPLLQWVNLDELVDTIVTSSAFPAHIEWRYWRQPTPFMMRADPAQLTQALRNLLGNAVQAIRSEGEGSGVIDLQASEKSGQYQLRLSDSGPGVAKEAQEKIFEPLYTTKAKGNGLGLWISRELIRGHGGDLRYVARDEDVSREVDKKGAEFLLVLPRGGQKETKLIST